MDSNAILHEVQQLYNVNDRLDSLAGQHPLVSEALIGISGSVRNTATFLSADRDENNAVLRIRSNQGAIGSSPSLSSVLGLRRGG